MFISVQNWFHTFSVEMMRDLRLLLLSLCILAVVVYGRNIEKRSIYANVTRVLLSRCVWVSWWCIGRSLVFHVRHFNITITSAILRFLDINDIVSCASLFVKAAMHYNLTTSRTVPWKQDRPKRLADQILRTWQVEFASGTNEYIQANIHAGRWFFESDQNTGSKHSDTCPTRVRVQYETSAVWCEYGMGHLKE